MKINRIFGMLIAALMVVGVPAQSLSAASATPQVTAEISRGCAAVERSVKGSPACAAALEKGLSADPANLKTFQDAAKANDTEAAKKLLMASGLTAQQLEGAKILIQDETGGSSASKLTITIKCCPLTIIITIKL